MASGPAALNSSRPILATPNQGRSVGGQAVRLDQVVDVEHQRQAAADRRSAAPSPSHRLASRPPASRHAPPPIRFTCTRRARRAARTSVPDPRSTRSATDRGSAKVAVPTCTARRTGEHQLDGVRRRGHATDPHDRAGRAARRAHRRQRGPRPGGWPGPRAPSAAARARGRRVLDVDHHAHHRVDQRDRLGAGLGRRRGDLDQPVGVGAQLRPPGQAGHRRGRDHLGRRPPGRGRTGGRRRPGWGSDRLTSTATTCAGHAGQRLGGAGVVLDACDPRCWPPRWPRWRAAPAARRSRHAATPGPWRPTLLIMPGGGLVHPWRRVARPRLGRRATSPPPRRGGDRST